MIGNGNVVGDATREVIQAVQAALLKATLMPAIVSAGINT